MQSSCLMWTLYKTDETGRNNWFPQGMLDVAILAANTSQLKITLEVTCFPLHIKSNIVPEDSSTNQSKKETLGHEELSSPPAQARQAQSLRSSLEESSLYLNSLIVLISLTITLQVSSSELIVFCLL